MIVAGAVGSGLVGNVDGVGAPDELGGAVGMGDEAGMDAVGADVSVADVSVTGGAGFPLLGELPSEAAEDCWLTGLRDGTGVSEARGKDLVVWVP